MKRVLITGATGFIGCRLAEVLVQHGVAVTGLVRTWANAARLTRLPVATVGGDLLDLDSVRAAMKGCDVVIHCAVDNRAYDAGDAERHQLSSSVGTANVLRVLTKRRRSISPVTWKCRSTLRPWLSASPRRPRCSDTSPGWISPPAWSGQR